MKKIFFTVILLCAIILHAQEIKVYGEPHPGGLMIGAGEKIISAKLNDTKLQIDKSGTFVFGFDRDAKGKFILRVQFQNKKSKTFEYILEKREYEEQSLRVEKKYVTPPRKLSARIKRELQLMKNARAKVGKIKDALFMKGFVYPVDSVDIGGVFGSQRILNGRPSNIHNGVDFHGMEGDSVYAITDGIVRIAGKDFFYNGNFILLDHGQGFTSVYLHMSKLIAKDGQKVKKGEVIGLIGTTGRSTGPHLHLGVQWYKKRIDPMSLFEIKF
jgi:murein DD-endopeptidase MepM/ murein hydrolase activator NlpD